MNKAHSVIASLSVILILGLAACRNSAPDEGASPSTAVGDPIAGERIFVSACTTCHGPRGEGVRGLSNDMTQSEFIASKTDPELVEFIKIGGAPGEPLVMLPKGGSPALSDGNLIDVVAYMRSLQKLSTGLGSK
jgi:mono/diheme cytochrome c family protein